jgi:two-component system, LuxR family, response regulator FixJ
MRSTNPTIYIIDDNDELCDSLRWLFESVQFNVETYQNAEMFLEKNSEIKFGCILIDVRMPGISGLELLEQLKSQKNRLPVIIITGYGDIAMAVRAMKAGAVDFILKPFNDQCLLEVVQKCINQSIHITSTDEICERIKQLSERELQIINLIVDGKLNKEIAFDLSISISTVEAHRSNIMQKMRAKNFAQLVKMYVHSKLANELN